MKEPYQSFITYIRCELALSAHTVLSYTYDLRQWDAFACATLGDDYDVTTITSNDLRLWIAHLAASGVSQRSIRRKIQTLRALFTFMMKRRGVAVNPAAELTPARLPKPLPRVVAPADTERALSVHVDPSNFVEVRDHLIVDMLYSTGMRASELVGLRDVDVNNSAMELKVLGKRNKQRVIPYGSNIANQIALYRRLRPVPCDDSFFVREDSKPIKYQHVNAIVKQAFAELPSHPTPHCLRHSCATDMLNDGAGLTAVKELLGHSSLATTQIYTHLSYSELKHNYELAHPRAKMKG